MYYKSVTPYGGAMSKARGGRDPARPQDPGGSEGAEERPWLWWSKDPGGPRRALEEYLQEVPARARAKMDVTIRRYKQGATRRGDVKPLGRGLYELRVSERNNHYRVIFFHWGSACVALTAFYKNQNAVPKEDIDRAVARRQTWLESRGAEPEA